MSNFNEALEAFQSATGSLLDELREYMNPCAAALPDARLAEGLRLSAAGMLAARSPEPAKAAAHAPQVHHNETAQRRRFCRLSKTPRLQPRQWLKVVYVDARGVVEASKVERVLVAPDPANSEKA